jgi:phosphate transport system permease protein
MSVRPASGAPVRARTSTRIRTSDRVGDVVLRTLCIGASLLACAAIVAIAYQLIHGSSLAFHKFGLGFITGTEWRPNFNQFGALAMLYGTAASSLMALIIAVPMGIAIALYLALLAPRGVRGVVGALVEMLAAVPSVIIGFWGILVLAPFVRDHIEHGAHSGLGFLPIFGDAQTSGSSIFTAGLVLALMVLPIIASVSRDLFLTVPRELRDGAEALGATRWEVVRGVILPATASGIAAATLLGLGRALGEAIAVTQVVGAGNDIHASLFRTGDTLASRIADQFAGALSKLHTSALFYLAVILLVMGLLANFGAQWIARRYDVNRVR